MNSPGELAVSHVRALSPYQPGKPMRELERELGVHDVLKLASNENPLGPSPLALAAMRRALDETWLYPDGAGHDLKQGLARHLGVGAAQLTLGNGSNDLLVLLAAAFLTPANNAVFSQFGFAIYALVTQAAGAQGRTVTAHPATVVPQADRQWLGHDLDAMAAAVDANTRLVFLANPNNPTGTWLGARAIQRFIESIPATTLVVLDEAYFEFGLPLGCQDGLRWLQRYPNLIVLRTFSKAYGLAGMRIGYGVSHPEVADILNRVRQPFNVGNVAMDGALAALGDPAHVAAGVALAASGREYFVREFQQLGLQVIPSAANFVTVSVGDGQRVYELLLQAGVIVRPLAGYGLPQFLRVSTGTQAQNERFVRSLRQCLAK
ncbi:MAG: histidinol-phosphate transaminase [Steroidobacteraceae bacterium]